MTDRMREAVKNDLLHTQLLIPDRLKTIERQIGRLIRDHETTGKLFTTEVMDLVTEAVGLLKDVSVSVELRHLATMDLVIEAPETPHE